MRGERAKMNDSIFQNIYDEIEQYIQFRWKKIVIYLEYGEESYTFLFYVNTGGEYVQCYDIKGINEDDLMDSFERIDEIVNEARSKDGQTWSNMTIVIGDDGELKVDYDYTDLSQGTYKYEKEWKNKYLV